MSKDDESTSSYAPKSPDLSSFYSSGPTQPASQLHAPRQGSGQYKLLPPAYTHGSSYAPPPMPSSAYSQQQHIKSEFPTYSPPSQLSQQPHPHPRSPQNLDHKNPAPQNLYGLQPASLRQSYSDQIYADPVQQQSPIKFQQTYPPESSKSTAQPDSEMPPRRAPPPVAPAIEPSPVRTKFPTARIKRIMQADEEVGKVAQQTPIAVGKALELFMIQLVSKSAEVAKEKGSKRVTAQMLKEVVETDDQWDFLREIVSRVENEKEGSKSKAKVESDSDEDSEPKRKSTRGRKRKM
ncbi:hypothetical protein QQS21_008537 [Conoideocrella luteorostrata]|uniref:NCT transcriptional regulatory complex subunit A n=1 Tax=Conoideocrella luteorostrata TaxID=1105319 RepID=A0AAJ0CIR5_9HYPO|nr:hypothetical protein QQS21_008537 [Conoideocrella luteorostrata]